MSRHLDPRYHFNRRKRLVLSGLCPECTAPREDMGFILCRKCREKRQQKSLAAWLASKQWEARKINE